MADLGRIVVPLARFQELRHSEVDPALRTMFDALIAKVRSAGVVETRRRGGDGRRDHRRPAKPNPGWRRPPAEGKRPLRATESDDESGREIVALCNKLSEGNFTIVSRKLTAHADGGGAVSVVREVLEQSARHGTFNSLYTDLLSALALGHGGAVEEEVVRRGDAFVASAGHLLTDSLWTEDYDAFCVFVATRKRRQSEFRSLCVMGCVDKLAPLADDALRRLPDPECSYSKDMLAEILCTFYQFDDSRGDATTATFSRCIDNADACGIPTKTRFVLMDMLPRVRPQRRRR